MGNLKHAIAAFMAVSLVGSLAVIQAIDFQAAKASKLTQEINIIEDRQNHRQHQRRNSSS